MVIKRLLKVSLERDTRFVLGDAMKQHFLYCFCVLGYTTVFNVTLAGENQLIQVRGRKSGRCNSGRVRSGEYSKVDKNQSEIILIHNK